MGAPTGRRPPRPPTSGDQCVVGAVAVRGRGGQRKGAQDPRIGCSELAETTSRGLLFGLDACALWPLGGSRTFFGCGPLAWGRVRLWSKRRYPAAHERLQRDRFPCPKWFTIGAPNPGAVVGALGTDLVFEGPVAGAEHLTGRRFS